MNETVLLSIPQDKSKQQMDKRPQHKNETIFVAN